MAHPGADQEIQVPQPVADAAPEPNADIPVPPPGAEQEVNILSFNFLIMPRARSSRFSHTISFLMLSC